MIDGVFDHQDSHGGGGSITNGDTQWMTAGSGHAAHRDAAGVAGAVGRPVPRHPALGEPAARRRSGRRRATRTCAPASSAWSPPPTPARWCGSSPATSAGTPAPARRTPRWRWCTRSLEPGRPARPAVAGGVQRARLRARRRRHGRARAAPRSRPGQLAVLGAGDFVTVAADGTPGRAAPRRWRCWCSAAGRSASRSPGPARS